MKKNILYLAALTVLAFSCAKEVKTGPNDDAIRYFQAWQKTHYPNADETALGAYIIEKQQGTGKEVKSEGYAIAEYVVTDLDGKISSYTNEETAKQLGAYSEIFYYGPKVINVNKGKIQAGVKDILMGLKVGGHVKAAIPSWLMTTSTYATKEEYQKETNDVPNYIYDVKIVDFTDNIYNWQLDSIGRFFKSHSDIFGNMTIKDTVKNIGGMYYKQLRKPTDTTSFKKDTTIYINYTGRLLNGKVFDTTDERLAKDNGLYSPSRTYGPQKVTWGDTASEIKLGTSTVNNGFSQTLWQMRPMEKGVGVFTSGHGYGDNGSGQTIPGFSPLMFEIEIVEKPKN